ncbi:saccharopine dehydrogenase-like oxidoreductase isoform X2 [Hydra vulgaris]|uniref:Saccharopine dehydrogenase-like oxidoreductase isoform X2 n=1 Tax=Hydra vulgaris TaxID=6087 RepID=A0ABM4DNB0_HYDVU
MSERPYDIAVYGASGYTGKYVAAEVVRTCQGKKIAIAGRSKAKLEKVFDIIEKECGWNTRGEVGIIIADSSNEESIREMCRQSCIVINCVGPFRWYGEQVVKACVDMATNYVDISGEPEYLQMLQLKYHKQAEEKGIHIVGACGFDSVPADVGLELLREKFNGELTAAESYIHLYGPQKGNYGTYLTIIHSVQGRENLKIQQKAIFKERLRFTGPKLLMRYPGFSKSENRWFIPFLGADPSVVRRTQLYESMNHNQTPIQYGAYFTAPSFLVAFFMILFGLLVWILTKFSFGIKLLENYPKIFSFGTFSFEGPSREDLARGGFKMVFHGKGYSEKPSSSAAAGKPDKGLSMQIIGPEIGYIFTSICVVACAKTILDDNLRNRGGVLTAGSAFKGTGLIDRLINRGVKFEIL